MGIGKGGNLPWRGLKQEMKHFTRLTKAKTNSTSRNAVLMGRKTWESIPKKFRPLPDRYNVVITSQLDYDVECSKEDAIVFSSISVTI